MCYRMETVKELKKNLRAIEIGGGASKATCQKHFAIEGRNEKWDDLAVWTGWADCEKCEEENP